jgi:GTP-binding protein
MRQASYHCRMKNPFARAQFALSGHRLADLPASVGRELAFAGRSNAGKSSAINAITGINGLARTSRTPGRTQQLVVFTLDDSHRLVDLPGYGYAKVPMAMREHWGVELSRYFAERESLVGLVLVMDARHPLKDNDWVLLEACAERGLPAMVLLTKADKLTRSDQNLVLRQVRAKLAEGGALVAARLFSSSKPIDLDRLRGELSEWLFRSQPPIP